MPIIEFYCQKCQIKFEELILRRDEISSIKCPKCRNKNIERLFSVFGVANKGSSKGNSESGSACTTCARPACTGCGK